MECQQALVHVAHMFKPSQLPKTVKPQNGRLKVSQGTP